MATDLRFGLELEMHGIVMTFRQQGSPNTFWPPPADDDWDSSMIGLEPILVPGIPTDQFTNPDGGMNWESNWGFRAVGDALGVVTIRQPDFPAVENAGSCILELATAAAPVDDFNYWITSRKCTQTFVAIMDDWRDKTAEYWDRKGLKGLIKDADGLWYPLQAFLNEYNDRVEVNLGRDTADRWKLRKSLKMFGFENGTHPRANGQKWDPYVKFRAKRFANDEGMPFRWCDVQVNYQINVSSLYNDTDTWINAWRSVWASRIQIHGAADGRTKEVALDPEVGDAKNTPTVEIYRNQTYAAMWRLAKAKVDEHFPPNALPAPYNALAKALVMYVLVASSITTQAEGTTTSKNAYPQLPKTSPASIRRAIEVMVAVTAPARAYFAQLAQPASQTRAAFLSADFLRHLDQLHAAPGNLPHERPMAPEQENDRFLEFYDEDARGILDGAPPNIPQPWQGAFDAANALTPANKMGFTTQAPFFVRWAHEVNSAYPAQTYWTEAKVPVIKMLFESRYGRSLMNIGYSPYIKDCLFNRSYRRMVELQLGPAAWTGAMKAAVDKAFPDDPRVQQKLTPGQFTH